MSPISNINISVQTNYHLPHPCCLYWDKGKKTKKQLIFNYNIKMLIGAYWQGSCDRYCRGCQNKIWANKGVGRRWQGRHAEEITIYELIKMSSSLFFFLVSRPTDVALRWSEVRMRSVFIFELIILNEFFFKRIKSELLMSLRARFLIVNLTY